MNKKYIVSSQMTRLEFLILKLKEGGILFFIFTSFFSKYWKLL